MAAMLRAFKMSRLAKLFALLAPFMSVDAVTCWEDKMRFPMYLKNTAGSKAAVWTAIEVSYTLSAIFVGGSVEYDSLLPGDKAVITNNSWLPVIGRLSEPQHLFIWRMVFEGDVDDAYFQQVSSLAIQADDHSKLAVAVCKRFSYEDNNQLKYTYFFVVDTAKGNQIGKAVEFYHGGNNDRHSMIVQNHGMIFKGGKIVAAFYPVQSKNWGDGWDNGSCAGQKYSAKLRIGCIGFTDTYSDPNVLPTIKYYKESNLYGYASGFKLIGSNLWLAGNTSPSGSAPVWGFSLFKLDSLSNPTSAASSYTLIHGDWKEKNNGKYHYIKHFAFDSPWWFGTLEGTLSSMPGGENLSACSGVWFFNPTTNDRYIKKLETTTTQRFAGMRETLDASGKGHFIICDETSKTYYYFIVGTGVDASSKIKFEPIHVADQLYAAKWLELTTSPSFLIGGYTCQNSFVVGKTTGESSGIFMSTVQSNTVSCYNTNSDCYPRTTASAQTKNVVRYQTADIQLETTRSLSFIPQTDADFCDHNTDPVLKSDILVKSWGLAADTVWLDATCDAGMGNYQNGVTIVAGSMQGTTPYVHIPGTDVQFSFNPPVVTGVTCFDTTQFSYQVILTSTTYLYSKNLNVVVNPATNQINVSSVYDSSGLYNIPVGVYTYTIRGHLPNGQYSDFSFPLTIGNPVTCSVTDAAQTNPATYSYTATPATFAFNPFTVTPTSCSTTYTCQKPAAESINFCTATGFTFSSTNGGFTFVTQDATTYPPGTYTINVVVQVGSETPITKTITLTLAYPPFTLTTNPFADRTQLLYDVLYNYSFVASSLANATNLLNTGLTLVQFTKPDTSILDSTVFTVNADANGSISPLVVNSITNPAKVGAYQVVYKVWLQNYPLMTATSAPFTVTVAEGCTLTTTTQTNPATYTYSSTPAAFVFNPFNVVPAGCPVTYACQMPTGSTINFCTAPGSTFSTTTGGFTFMTQDAITYPPGAYTIEVVVTSGASSFTTSFVLTLAYPPLTLQASPFADHTQVLNAADFSYTFDASSLAVATNLVNPGLTFVQFMKPDTSSLDTTIFTIYSDAFGNISPLVVNSVSNPAKVGAYQVVYKVWLQNYPLMTATSAPFTVTVADCIVTATSQTNPATYTYTATAASFVMTPFTSVPASCPITYACQMPTGSTINFCTAPGSTFSTTTGGFTFVTQDAATYPPGTYTIQIVGTSGSSSQTTSFQLTLQYPPFILNGSPFADHNQSIFDPSFSYNFDVNTLAVATNLLNPGLTLVQFTKPDLTSLDTTIFTIHSDANGEISPLVVNSVSDFLKVGAYQVVYKVWLQNYPLMTATSAPFTVTVVDNCLLTVTAQTNPAVYKYSATPASFVLNPFTVTPAGCPITYACQMPTGSTINFCTAPGSTFSTTTGGFTFVTQDAATYPPGTYTIQIVGTSGSSSQTTSFQLTLAYPTFTLTANPFADHTQKIGDAAFQYSFVPSSLAQTTNLLNPGLTMVSFMKPDTTSLDTAIFTVNSGASGASSPLIVNSILDTLKVGAYQVVYKVWLQNYPLMTATSAPFNINVEVDCSTVQLKEGATQFTDQNYLLGSPGIQMTWKDNLLATLPSGVDCGQIAILDFYTKAGSIKKPLDKLLFDADLSGNKLTIKSTDPTKVGQYTVYFKIGLKSFVSNSFETKTPFKVVVTKPNSAPQLSDLASKQVRFAVQIPVPAEDQTISVGQVVDDENDKVTVEFSSLGSELITYNQALGQLQVANTIEEGTYIVTIKLEDNNADGPLSTTYSVVVQVTRATEEPAKNSTETKATTAFSVPTLPKTIEETQQQKVKVVQDGKQEKEEKKTKQPQNPKMKLESMSSFGVLHFTFDQMMIIPSNLTMLNETVLDVSLLRPGGRVYKRNLEVEEAREDNLNFTWNITEFKASHMDLQLYFEEAYYVTTPDTMRVKILLKDDFFVANYTRKTLLEDNIEFNIFCVPQIQLGDSADKLAGASSAADTGTKGLLGANIAMNVLLSGALSMLWGMINGLQLVALLPMCSVDMPGNAQVVFTQIYMIAAFNIINVDSITTNIAHFLKLEVSSAHVSGRLQSLGFESTNVIVNLGLVFLFMMFFAFVVLVQLILEGLAKYYPNNERFKRWSDQIKKKLYWNFFIRVFLETYIDQAFVQILRLQATNFTPFSEVLSFLVANLVIAILLILPFFGYFLLWKNKHLLNYPSMKAKYEAAYENVKTRYNSTLAFSLVFCMKRLIFASLIMKLEKHSVMQTMMILHLLLAGACYSWYTFPFEERTNNQQECFNDAWTLCITYCLVVFSDLVPDKKTQYKMGWIVCGLVGFDIAVNLGFIVFVSFKTESFKIKVKWPGWKRRLNKFWTRLWTSEEKTAEKPRDPNELFVRRNQKITRPAPNLSHISLESFEDLDNVESGLDKQPEVIEVKMNNSKKQPLKKSKMPTKLHIIEEEAPQQDNSEDSIRLQSQGNLSNIQTKTQVKVKTTENVDDEEEKNPPNQLKHTPLSTQPEKKKFTPQRPSQMRPLAKQTQFVRNTQIKKPVLPVKLRINSRSISTESPITNANILQPTHILQTQNEQAQQPQQSLVAEQNLQEIQVIENVLDMNADIPIFNDHWFLRC